MKQPRTFNTFEDYCVHRFELLPKDITGLMSIYDNVQEEKIRRVKSREVAEEYLYKAWRGLKLQGEDEFIKIAEVKGWDITMTSEE